MKKLLLLAAVAALTAPAIARAQAPAQPAYAPITLSETDYTTIMNYLGAQPFNMSATLVNFFAQREQAARAAAAEKAKAKKPATPEPPTPANP